MPRYLKVILGTLAGLVLVIAVGVILVVTFNWNHARPWVSEQLSELTHREVAIHGDLSVDWVRPQAQSGWHRWVPWPQVTAEQVVVGNPPWIGSQSNMGEARQVTVVLNPFPLLAKTVQLFRLDLQGAVISLIRTGAGKKNWTLQEKDNKKKEPSEWTFDVQKLSLQQVAIRLADATRNIDIKTDIDSLKDSSPEGYGVSWKASGTYNDAAVSGEGQAGKILSLQEGSDPFPLMADLKVGETVIGIQGSVTRPTALAALDLRLKLAGDSMADLYPLFGIALPNTPPYATEGRLIGSLETDHDTWRYENFKGTVGSSDLEGTLDYLVREPRSLLSGSVQSRLLQFKDLGPLIGVESSGRKGKTKAKSKQPAGKVLPHDVIGTDKWGAMDADVVFAGEKIVQTKDLPLDNVKAHIKLQNSVLTLDPLNFGMAGGNLASVIELNGRQPTIKATMSVSARHLKLKKLLRGADTMKSSLGELNGDAKLSGQGKTIAQLLGSSNGEVKAVVSKGTISHLLLETAGLNVANIIMVKIFGDEQVVLNCLASDFDVSKGVMTVQAFQLDTEDAIINVTGQINLATEHFDLDIKPENKSVRIFTLRTPLYVKGTFKDPDVGVHTGPLAARAGAAVLLGVVATPLAALLPLLNLGTDDSNECASVVAASKQKPKAPPPGKTKKAEPQAKAQ